MPAWPVLERHSEVKLRKLVSCRKKILFKNISMEISVDSGFYSVAAQKKSFKLVFLHFIHLG